MLNPSTRPPLRTGSRGLAGRARVPKRNARTPLPPSRRSQSKSFQPKTLSRHEGRSSPSGGIPLGASGSLTRLPRKGSRLSWKGAGLLGRRSEAESKAPKSESPVEWGCLRVGPPSHGTLAPPILPPPPPPRARSASPRAGRAHLLLGLGRAGISPSRSTPTPQRALGKAESSTRSLTYLSFFFPSSSSSFPGPVTSPLGTFSQARTPKRELVSTSLALPLGALPSAAALSAPGEGRAQYLTPPWCSP